MIRKIIEIEHKFDTKMWEDFLYRARSNINSTPFDEILSFSVGNIILETDNIIDEGNIKKEINKMLGFINIQQADMKISNLDDNFINNYLLENIPIYNSDNKVKYTYEYTKKELEVVLQTEINHSYYLCVILTNDKLYPWFYENFIQISYETSGVVYGDCYYVCNDLIEKQVVGYELLEKEPDIVKFIIEKIKQDYYIITWIDEFYLPEMSKYRKLHFVHPLLIYGFDNENRKLISIAFDPFKGFSRFTYDYNTFTEAFEKGKLYYMCAGEQAKTQAVELFKLKEYNEDYPFDM